MGALAGFVLGYALLLRSEVVKQHRDADAPFGFLHNGETEDVRHELQRCYGRWQVRYLFLQALS